MDSVVVPLSIVVMMISIPTLSSFVLFVVVFIVMLFLLVLFFAPGRGVLATLLLRNRRNQETLDCLVLQWIHDSTSGESSADKWLAERRWQGSIERMLASKWIAWAENKLVLTDAGETRLATKLAEIA